MELKPLHHLQTAFNWLIPRRCITCGIALTDKCHPCCATCYQQLPFQNHCCDRCGQVFSAHEDMCGRCLISPPLFDACFCPFRYESPISDQVQLFKYGQRPELASALARALFTEIKANNLDIPDLLIPVPIHISRLRERGYNQSLMLAKHLSSLLSIPFSNKIIEKHRATPPQVKQTLKQRQRNVRGSFRLCSRIDADSVAIIDDVFTTGSTASEITKILKRNGVNYVQVWAVAHTV